MTFLEIATPLLARGLPLTPLKSRSKIAFLEDWPKNPITTLEQAKECVQKYGPDLNCGVVAQAKPGGVCIFEIDDPDIFNSVKELDLPSTYIVRSSIGRGHLYFHHTPASILFGNQSADDPSGKESWSFRADSQYVVSEKSIHPKTGEPYDARSTADIAPIPDRLLEWMKIHKPKKEEPKEDLKSQEFYPEGSRNKSLTSAAGALRHMGLDYNGVYSALVSLNDQKCQPPLSDEEVSTIARSICRYPVGKNEDVMVAGKLAGTAYGVEPAQYGIDTGEPEEAIEIQTVDYPVFPRWILEGTSLNENLIKPFCDLNSREPEFMWMPAMTILLNYIGLKCRIEYKPHIPSIFLAMIGRRGRLFKSHCVSDALKFFEYAGMVGYSGPTVRNAEGRSMIITPGSSEGLGKELNRLNCKNFIILYDELSTLTNKATIESSTLSSTLLTLYESTNLQNTIKVSKDSFAFQGGDYCASLITCSTDKNFLSNWSKLAGKSTGLDDRFFFLFQPKKLKELTDYKHPFIQDGATKTRQLVEKAIQKGTYTIVDTSPLKKYIQENQDSSRASIRAEKFALGFAIDMGLDEIDEECLERALCLVEYEQKVKKYLHMYEATTREGALQMDILYNLRRNGGKMNLRDLNRVIHPERYGTSLWNSVYTGLLKSGWCKETGAGTKGDPKFLIALRLPEDDED